MNKNFSLIGLMIVLISCGGKRSYTLQEVKSLNISNSEVLNYPILDCMYEDDYFPDIMVDKCKLVLLNLCFQIEVNQPGNLEELYVLTHTATRYINDLEDEFFANGSEIETVARECLGADIYFISKAYGFDADVEELIAPRRW